jgi:hypothetical protein
MSPEDEHSIEKDVFYSITRDFVKDAIEQFSSYQVSEVEMSLLWKIIDDTIIDYLTDCINAAVDLEDFYKRVSEANSKT